jgi:hypothetical protein
MIYYFHTTKQDLLNEYHDGWWDRVCENTEDCSGDCYCERKHSFLNEDKLDILDEDLSNIKNKKNKLIAEISKKECFIFDNINLPIPLINFLQKNDIQYDLINYDTLHANISTLILYDSFMYNLFNFRLGLPIRNYRNLKLILSNINCDYYFALFENRTQLKDKTIEMYYVHNNKIYFYRQQDCDTYKENYIAYKMSMPPVNTTIPIMSFL